MFLHPYATWDKPDPDYVPVITGVLPSSSRMPWEQSARFNAHLRRTPFEPSSRLPSDTPTDVSLSPSSSNLSSLNDHSNGSGSGSENQENQSYEPNTMSANQWKHFQFVGMKPDVLNCTVADTQNRPIFRIQSDFICSFSSGGCS